MKDYCDWDFLNRDFSEEERARLAKSGAALPDGSFPIVTTEDLDNAIRAIGRASNPAAAKAHIIKRARALGAEDHLPEDWRGGQSNWTPKRPKALLTKGDWYRIENKADGPSDVFIYDEIGGYGVSSGSFLNELRDVKGPLNLHLNSPGGDVFDGLTIYQAIKSRGNVTVHIDGLAASIASVIAQGAEKVVMAPKATMMIHDGWTAAQGNAGDMRKLADLLDKTSNNIASVYSDKAGGSVEFWRARMQEETWYSAQEALDAGLVDEVDGLTKAPSSFDTSMFNHAGREVAPAPVLRDETPPVPPVVDKKTDEEEPFTWDFSAFKAAFQEGVN